MFNGKGSEIPCGEFGKRATVSLRTYVVPGIVAAVIIFCGFIWRNAMIRDERAQDQITTNEAAVAFEHHLIYRVREDAETLERLAASIKVAGDSSFERWQPDAVNLVKDFPEFQAIEWIDKDFRIRWVEPLEGNEKALDIDLTFESRRKSAVQTAFEGRTSMSKVINFVQGGRGFLLYAPVMRDGEFMGMVAGVCNIDGLISTVPYHITSQYNFSIIEGESLLFKTDESIVGSSTVHSTMTADMLGTSWEIDLQPSTSTLKSWRSPLPNIFLGMSVFVATAIYFALWQLCRTRSIIRRDREIQQFLEALSNTSLGYTYVFDFDSGRFTFFNRYSAEHLGIEEGAYVRDFSIHQMSHEEDAEAQLGAVERLKENREEFVEFESRWQVASGQWRHLHHQMRTMTRDRDGNPLLVVGSAFDLTEQKINERTTERNRETLDSIIESSAIGMALVSPDGKWLRVNKALCAFLGYSEGELLVADFQTITHADDLDKDLSLVMDVLEGRIATYQMEKRYLRKDGSVVWALLSVSLSRDADGEPICFISQVQDINEMKLRQMEESMNALRLQSEADEMKTLAFTDKLTAIPNRRQFDQSLETLLERAKLSDRALSVILMDIDNFKKFNDDFGHETGDLVLRAVAKTLNQNKRGNDLVARYGGEEFVVLCNDCDLKRAMVVAERLRVNIENCFPDGHRVTASFGVSTLNPQNQNDNLLVSHADAALYFAKAEGRNCVRSTDDLESAA